MPVILQWGFGVALPGCWGMSERLVGPVDQLKAISMASQDPKNPCLARRMLRMRMGVEIVGPGRTSFES